VARLRDALERLSIEGVETTCDLHRAIVADPRFTTGGVDTRFFEGLDHG
jgi:acetyl-CoA carboxylase, biotin carboxylase subunit